MIGFDIGGTKCAVCIGQGNRGRKSSRGKQCMHCGSGDRDIQGAGISSAGVPLSLCGGRSIFL